MDLFVTHNREQIREREILYADSTFFDVFSAQFISGNPDFALTEPNSIVLTQSLADKYFPDENPYGKDFHISGLPTLKVTGIIEDVPSNTHLRYSGLISMSTLAMIHGPDEFNSFHPMHFWSLSYYSFLLLHENADIVEIEEGLPGFYEKYLSQSMGDLQGEMEIEFTPLGEIYLSSHADYDFASGNTRYLYIFLLVGTLIMLIAVLNYINLATAMARRRLKEAALKKVLGANNFQLSAQFIVESLALVLFSVILALGLLPVVFQLIKSIAHVELNPLMVFDTGFLLYFATVLVFVALFSAGYPAYVVSRFNPAETFTMEKRGARRSFLSRKVLVTAQLAISVGMILSSLLISQQVRYMVNKDPGFDPTNIIQLSFWQNQQHTRTISFLNEINNLPEVKHAAASHEGLTTSHIKMILQAERADGGRSERLFRVMFVTHEFISTMGLDLSVGRDFERSNREDNHFAAIVNESFVREMGWGDDPLGKKIDWGYDENMMPTNFGEVIGVLKDFHYKSLHTPIEPMVFILIDSDEMLRTIKIRYSAENPQYALNAIRSVYSDVFPELPMDYRFIEWEMEQLYINEKIALRLFMLLTFIAIGLSLIGIIGLSSFVAKQSEKEIAIRKVFGASVDAILFRLYKEYIALYLLALIVAIPLVWYFMDQWLATFHYGISFNWLNVLLTAILSILFVMPVVTWHGLRASMSNPAKVLYAE
ncbi:MAG: ABC transporter permease [Bacteroidetes bacterium]|nr:MAG: ABC transporter permease [Bacteroidota bacterium]